MKIADIPFAERPLDELLHFADDRTEVDRNYAGYGWSLADTLWLADASGSLVELESVLVVGVHSADDAERVPGDVELEFELPGRAPVAVLATQFFAQHLARLPRRTHTVIAMCNPHRERLPASAQWCSGQLWYPLGNVESWIDDSKGGRIELVSDGSWVSFRA